MHHLQTLIFSLITSLLLSPLHLHLHLIRNSLRHRRRRRRDLAGVSPHSASERDQGRFFSGRRLVPPSSGNNGIPHTERKLPVPNSWHKLQVPPGISKPSSSSISPYAMEKIGNTPEQKPLEQIIVRYYGKAYFSWSSLPQDAKDESFKRFSANYRWDPSISDLVRRDYEKTCAKTADEMADMERRLRMEQKLVQCCSRSRVHLLHVKFLRKIS
ncbi:hypothetical protein Droror1_Dr00011748 [Drosera rotundifolia]